MNNKLCGPSQLYHSDLRDIVCNNDMIIADRYSKHLEALKDYGFQTALSPAECVRIAQELDDVPLTKDTQDRATSLMRHVISTYPKLTKELQPLKNIRWLPACCDNQTKHMAPKDVYVHTHKSLVHLVCWVSVTGFKNTQLTEQLFRAGPPDVDHVLEQANKLNELQRQFLEDPKKFPERPGNRTVITTHLTSRLVPPTDTSLKHNNGKMKGDNERDLLQAKLATSVWVLDSDNLFQTPSRILLSTSYVTDDLRPVYCSLSPELSSACKDGPLGGLLKTMGAKPFMTSRDLVLLTRPGVPIPDDTVVQLGNSLILHTKEDLHVLTTTGERVLATDVYVAENFGVTVKTDKHLLSPKYSLQCAREFRSIRELLMGEDDARGEAFKQEVDVQDEISKILRMYNAPETCLLYELLQNADDAGATEMSVIVDERCHTTEEKNTLLFQGFKDFSGPSLMVHNNMPFTEEDLESYQHVARSCKVDADKIGQWGIGSLVVYHITDIPQFVTGSHMLFSDPLGLVDKRKNGRKVPLHGPFQDQWNQFRCNAVNTNPPNHVNGVLFRFPLRIKASPISEDCLTTTELLQLQEDFLVRVCGPLLFLGTVKHIKAYRWLAKQGHPQKCGTVKCSPATERDDKIQQQFRNSIKERAPVGALHHYQMITTKGKYSNKWQITTTLLESDSKRACWCGVAFCMNNPSLSYCKVLSFLPLSIDSGLPFLIHANFEVSGDRKKLVSGQDGKNSEWNQRLLEACGQCAAVCLEEHVCSGADDVEEKEDEIEKFLPAKSDATFGCLVTSFYVHAKQTWKWGPDQLPLKDQLVYCKLPTELLCLFDEWFQDSPIVQMSATVIRHFQESGVELDCLTNTVICDYINNKRPGLTCLQAWLLIDLLSQQHQLPDPTTCTIPGDLPIVPLLNGKQVSLNELEELFWPTETQSNLYKDSPAAALCAETADFGDPQRIDITKVLSPYIKVTPVEHQTPLQYNQKHKWNPDTNWLKEFWQCLEEDNLDTKAQRWPEHTMIDTNGALYSFQEGCRLPFYDEEVSDILPHCKIPIIPAEDFLPERVLGRYKDNNVNKILTALFERRKELQLSSECAANLRKFFGSTFTTIDSKSKLLKLPIFPSATSSEYLVRGKKKGQYVQREIAYHFDMIEQDYDNLLSPTIEEEPLTRYLKLCN